MGIILAVLQYSGKIPSDNELLKSIEIVGDIRGAKSIYINTEIFMVSVDLLFCLWIRLTISSLSEGRKKNKFSTGASRKFKGELFEWGILQSRLEAMFEK